MFLPPIGSTGGPINPPPYQTSDHLVPSTTPAPCPSEDTTKGQKSKPFELCK